MHALNGMTHHVRARLDSAGPSVRGKATKRSIFCFAKQRNMQQGNQRL
jgi:hypothetical protein